MTVNRYNLGGRRRIRDHSKRLKLQSLSFDGETQK